MTPTDFDKRVENLVYAITRGTKSVEEVCEAGDSLFIDLVLSDPDNQELREMARDWTEQKAEMRHQQLLLDESKAEIKRLQAEQARLRYLIDEQKNGGNA